MARWSRRSRWNGGWAPYVPVAERRARAARKIKQIEKSGRKVEPVRVSGRAIATTFWGKSWCQNLERYSDYENRLPRGRTYVRNGSVIDLQIEPCRVTALVSGSEIYKVSVGFASVTKARWKHVKGLCAGRIDSLVELLKGRFSKGVMDVLTDQETGILPAPGEIELQCSCPDWATMCKHVAAVLYGVGVRLDSRPDLLFVLRGVDPTELVSEAAAGAAWVGAPASGEALDASQIEDIFGIEIEAPSAGPEPAEKDPPAARKRPESDRSPRRRSASGFPEARDAKARSRSKGRPAAKAKVGSNGKEGARAKAAGSNPASSRLRRDRRKDVLDSRVPALREYFFESDTLTNAQYRDLFGVPLAVATRELGKLTDRYVLIREGTKRGARYLAGVDLF